MKNKYKIVVFLLLVLWVSPCFGQRVVKQSVAYDLRVLMIDSTDHVTGKTGLTLTITAAKSGTNTLSSISPTVTEIGNGWYNVALTTTHTNTVGDMAIHITGTAADPTDVAIVVRENVLGDTLPANVLQFGSSNGTFSGGRPEVNTSHLSGTLQTGRDIGASVLLSNGTGTGQLKLSSGYVSPNWADVGNPTTTVNLSGTTVKTATDVETDTQNLQSRIPASLGSNGNIKADVRDWLDTAAATPTVAGVPEVDVTYANGEVIDTTGTVDANLVEISDDAQSATDLKDLADTGYNPSTHKVQGVVLTDTVTTYTGNTPQTGDSYARIGSNGSGLTTLATASALSAVSGRIPASLSGDGLMQVDVIRYAGTLQSNGDLPIKLDNIYNRIGAPSGASISADIQTRASQMSVDTLDAVVDLITQQFIRDALKLAPSVGSPAAGSVDKHLDTIEKAAITK